MQLLNTNGVKTLINSINDNFLKIGEIIPPAPRILEISSKNKLATIDNLEMGTYVVINGEINSLTISQIIAGSYTEGKESFAYVQFNPDQKFSLEEEYKVQIKGNVVWNTDQTNNVKKSDICRLEIRCIDNIYYAKINNSNG